MKVKINIIAPKIKIIMRKCVLIQFPTLLFSSGQIIFRDQRGREDLAMLKSEVEYFLGNCGNVNKRNPFELFEKSILGSE